jgi:hypothetical protein
MADTEPTDLSGTHCAECGEELLPSPEMGGHVYICPEHIVDESDKGSRRELAQLYVRRVRALQEKLGVATISTRPRVPPPPPEPDPQAPVNVQPITQRSGRGAPTNTSRRFFQRRK